MGTLTAIDLFAGLGGFTEAATLAGVRVLYAANHWRAAVDVHAANHPDVTHACQDLQQADWSAVPRHDLLLASPCCQGHAKARGKDRPGHDASRSTAWAVASCAEYHRPAAIVVENVPEFRQWSLFPSWLDAMNRLGYALAEHVWDAADAGVPQHRVRFLGVLTRSRAPLVIRPPAVEHSPAVDVIDWSGGRWSAVERAGRATNTLARWRHGRAAFGERFVFSYYGNTRTGRAVTRPIGTITTRDRWAAVDGDRMRMLTADECRAFMGFRPGYILPRQHRPAVHMLGNAVSPPFGAHAIREIARAA